MLITLISKIVNILEYLEDLKRHYMSGWTERSVKGQFRKMAIMMMMVMVTMMEIKITLLMASKK